ncbi:putative transcription coactivator Tc-PD family [Helianthus annuus]|nr:putative transcription coactivator Tc-PD family [Helianthus annuus]
MAVFASLHFTPPLTFHTNQLHKSFNLNHHPLRSNLGSKTSRRARILAMGPDLLGDFGARDPFPAEIESNFGDKVIGAHDTEHKILIPNIAALALSKLECTPVSDLQAPMSQDDAKTLLRKVIGWKLVNEDGILKLQCLWKLKDSECVEELINRINKAVESTGLSPNIHRIQSNQVKAELWTSSIGGLSMNDFIVASKIDEIKYTDLVPRKRAWA